MKEMQQRIEDLRVHVGTGRDVCRVLAFFPSIPEDNDLRVPALQAVEDWICQWAAEKPALLAWASGHTIEFSLRPNRAPALALVIQLIVY